MSETEEFKDLRLQFKKTLLGDIKEHIPEIELIKPINTIEKKLFNASVKCRWDDNSITHIDHYKILMEKTIKEFRKVTGIISKETLLYQFIKSEFRHPDIINYILYEYKKIDHRKVIKRLFVKTLTESHEKYANNIELAVNTATLIELSCYNNVISACKLSDEPPVRHWDSTLFVDAYSIRCGTINSLIDKNSSVCRAYNSTCIEDLVSEKLNPKTLGKLTPADLCPSATEKERAEIKFRSEQKVIMKTSSLFKCPSCGARECTYREVQRRALDEAPDYPCVCLKCNRRFTGRS